MPAYVIVDLQELIDADKLNAYRPHGAAAVKKYGGRYIARGGETASLEGGWTSQRITILEFDSLDQARAWYDSPEYAAARKIREGASRTRILAVEGVA
ncbi:MAG TPA: DUF1330 domain-containing protein [Hyphomicrobiaceae bacterium]|jgi:uncharacterized protein (DUF1330 family)